MENKTSLKKILSKNFFQTTLIPLIVIELTLIVMYFGINSFMVNKSKESLYSEIKLNLNSILNKEAQSINFHLKEISNISKVLQHDQENKFKEKENIIKILKDIKFDFAPNGVYYKQNDNGGASLFYATNTPIGSTQKDKALFTESFDPLLKYSVDNFNLIVASYFNSYDDMNRLYPFIPKVYEQFDPKINMEDYNFYYKADLKHNPSKKPTWTSAYLDPAGQGWMISCVVPIYTDEFLQGVTGLDVTISSFINDILNLKLPWDANGFLVDKDGTILAMPKKVEEILKLKELKGHNYTNTIKETNLKPEDLNIIKNKNIYPYFKELIEDNNFMSQKNINGKDYILAQKNIEETGWKLFTIVDKDVVYEPIVEIEEFAQNIGKLAISGMILFYIIFFILISRRIRNISSTISEPISKLAKLTKHYSINYKIAKIDDNNIQEIHTLSKNFKEMTDQLNEKTLSLKKLNSTLEDRIKKEVENNIKKEHMLVHQSRLAQLGEMISMIAHQWRQPLSTISTKIVSIQVKIGLGKFDFYTKEGVDEFLSYIKKETKDLEEYVETLTNTIDDFRNFYKSDKNSVEIEINQPLNKALNIIQPKIDIHNIEVKKEFNSKNIILAFERELLQVFLNILNNTIDNFEDKKTINPVINIKTEDLENSVMISICDNGGGIKEDILENIFDPYFSTKQEKNGTGLGLYITKTIIEKHHNSKIEVKNINNGVCFEIELNNK